jgi:hypothetical protein
MNKRIEKHSEEGFVRGFNRYFLSQLIVDSESWHDFVKELTRYEISDELNACYGEYRLFNIFLLLQQILPEIIGLAYKHNCLENEQALKKFVLEKTGRYLKINEEEAEKILQKEIIGNDTSFYTPHVLLYVVGLGLGELIHIVRSHVRFPGIDAQKITNELSKLNKERNVLMHNLFTSRIPELQLTELIELAKNILKTLQDIHAEYLSKANP